MQLFRNDLIYRECFSEIVSSICRGTIAQIAIPFSMDPDIWYFCLPGIYLSSHKQFPLVSFKSSMF